MLGLFHLIPGVVETTTRLPLSSPLNLDWNALAAELTEGSGRSIGMADA